ncbi:MAG: PEP-CTERM sorting domain-containing protein [Planctomycetota bacterium]
MRTTTLILIVAALFAFEKSADADTIIYKIEQIQDPFAASSIHSGTQQMATVFNDHLGRGVDVYKSGTKLWHNLTGYIKADRDIPGKKITFLEGEIHGTELSGSGFYVDGFLETQVDIDATVLGGQLHDANNDGKAMGHITLRITQDGFLTSTDVTFFFEDFFYVPNFANSFSPNLQQVHLWGNNTEPLDNSDLDALHVHGGVSVSGPPVDEGTIWTRDRLGLDLRLVAVPEPASMVLVAAGAAVIAIRRRRKRVA